MTVTSDSDDSASRQGFDVGQRLQAVRKRCGLSQRELARRAEMTNGSLSMIEQGKASPSINSLERILKAVPMSLVDFFSDAHELTSPVLPAQDFIRVRKAGANFEVMQVPDTADRVAHLAQKTVQPGGTTTGRWMAYSGIVAGIMISGEIVLILDGVEYNLGEGDGYYFALNRAHKFENRSANPAVVVAATFSSQSGVLLDS